MQDDAVAPGVFRPGKAGPEGPGHRRGITRRDLTAGKDMATSITDGKGSSWLISGSAGPLKRIRDLTGIDLGLLHDDGKLAEFNSILEDRERCLAVLRAACGEFVAKLSADDWEDLWPVESLLKAMFDLGREVARFFTPLRSKAVISALNRLELEYQRQLERLGQEIDGTPSPTSAPHPPSTELSSSGESSASIPAH